MQSTYSSTETLVQSCEEDVLQVLYDSLKCPNTKCRTYMYPPIFICSSGHSLCVDCTEGAYCPLCKQPILTIRNSTLEEITQKILYQCKNHVYGCDQLFPAYELFQHELECEHRLHACFSGKCPWVGRRWDIVPHMRTVHPDKLARGSVLNFHVDASENIDVYDDLMMVLYSSEKFWVRFVFDKLDTSFHAAVQYVGKYKHCTRYDYQVSLAVSRKGDEVKKKRFVYRRETHSIASDFKTIFQSGDCFVLRLDSDKYVIRDNFEVKVKIEETL